MRLERFNRPAGYHNVVRSAVVTYLPCEEEGVNGFLGHMEKHSPYKVLKVGYNVRSGRYTATIGTKIDCLFDPSGFARHYKELKDEYLLKHDKGSAPFLDRGVPMWMLAHKKHEREQTLTPELKKLLLDVAGIKVNKDGKGGYVVSKILATVKNMNEVGAIVGKEILKTNT